MRQYSGRSSHPPALLKRTLRTLREETCLKAGDGVVVAVSGGGDSSALLHVLAQLRSKLGIQVFAHGVNHGLRSEAAQELELVRALAARLEVPFSSTQLRLPAGGNLQARARQARYTALNAAATSVRASWIATAHHADDRAETLLLRLLRGTGARGLSPLPAQSSNRLRPFIRSGKAAVLAHLERHAISFACDPSNANRRFLRTRVRHELMPLMENLVPGIADRLNQLADDCHELGDGAEPSGEGHTASANALELSAVHQRQIRRARKLNQRSAEIWLPGGVSVRVDPSTGQLVSSAHTRSIKDSEKRVGLRQKLGSGGAKDSKSD